MASSSSLLKQINNDYLTCQICMEPYQSPKVLTCLHTFCKNCLELCEKSTHETYILCPLCRETTTLGLKGIDGLKNNFILSNMATVMKEWKSFHSRDENSTESVTMCETCPQNESVKATYQCISCLDQLCADCAAFHNRTKLTKEHKVVSLEEIKSSKYKEQIHQEEMSRCDKHKNEKFELYCQDCDKLICRICIKEDHSSHLLTSVKEASAIFKNKIQIIQEEMEEIAQSSKKSLEMVEKLQEENISLDKIKKELEQKVEDIIKIVKQKKAEILETIKEHQQDNEEQLFTVKGQLENQIQNIENSIQLSKCLIQTGTTKELYSLKKEIHNTILNLQASNETAQVYKKTFHHIRYFPENNCLMISKVMGYIQKKENTIASLIGMDCFKKIECLKQTANSTNNSIEFFNKQKPNCLKKDYAKSRQEILFVELPKSKPHPTPKPRKQLHKKTSVTKNETSNSIYQTKNDTTVNYKKNMTLYRVAPAPPKSLCTTLKKINPDETKLVKNKSLKKGPAPLPPSITPGSSIIKAKLIKKFELQNKLNLKDNNYTSQGLVITKEYIIVLDPEGKQVILYNNEGGYSWKFSVKNPNQGRCYPTGLTISSSGLFYILYPELVTVWTINGTYQSSFGQNELIDAHGIAIDKNERIIIADEGKQQIVIFDNAGNYLNSFTKHLHTPRWICTTSKNDIVVTDYYQNQVIIFDYNGLYISVCNSNESRMKLPRGIATIQDNHNLTELVLVVDEANKRVTAYNCKGKFLYHVLESDKDCNIKSPKIIAVYNNETLGLLQSDSKDCQLFNLQKKTFAF